MSLVLNGTTQYAWRNAPVVNVAPFAVSAWFKSTSDSALQAIWGEAYQATTLDYWRLGLRGNEEGDPVGCYIRRNGEANAITSTGYMVNQWHHAMFVEAGTQDHRVYIDGESEGSDTSNDQNPLNENRMSIGALAYDGGWANFFAGKLAEVALWTNVILTVEDIAFLAGGADPNIIQPDFQKAYWPLLEDANDDWSNNLHLTEAGSPSFDTNDHPTIGGAAKASMVYYLNHIFSG
jgi:hypothetical protein